MRCGPSLAVFFIASTLAATPVSVTLNGKPVDGAEICWFKAFDAVTCHAAADGVPTGNWSIFARKGDQLVSDRVVSGGDVSLAAAAKLTDAAYVYVLRTRSILPVQQHLIPADSDVVPLQVAGRKIVAFGNIVNVHGGAAAKAEFVPARDGRANVIATIAAREKSDIRVPPPDVVTQTGDKSDKPLDPLRVTDTAPTLLFFRDVQAGAKLVISGKRWKTTEVPIIAKEKFLMLDPITSIQTSKIEVSWWAPVELAKFATKQTECKITKSAFPFFEKRSTESKFVAILEQCRNGRSSCTEMARRELPTNAMKGTFAIDDVAAGTYVLEFDYPGLPVVSKGFEVTSNENTPIDVTLHYLTFYGKVTRDGKPVHAMLYGAVTDPDTGEYNAVVTRLPGPQNTTEVLPCDGGPAYRFIPEDAPKENAAFDIEIPTNSLAIEVHDKDTGAPVANADVNMGAELPGQSSAMHFMGPAGKTDADGKLTLAPVLQNRMVKICAAREDYEAKCAPDFKMDAPEKSLRLDLKNVPVRHGRVATGAGHGAQIAWFNPQTGSINEGIRSFKEDGSFTYQKVHAPGEIVVLTSADLPLYAFLQNALDADAVFEISRPAAAVRAFTVSLADTYKGSIGVALMIGDVFVPDYGLQSHLLPRVHVISRLQPGGSVQISDILQTGPIKVIMMPSPGANMPFAAYLATCPTKDLGDSDGVVFP